MGKGGGRQHFQAAAEQALAAVHKAKAGQVARRQRMPQRVQHHPPLTVLHPERFLIRQTHAQCLYTHQDSWFWKDLATRPTHETIHNMIWSSG